MTTRLDVALLPSEATAIDAEAFVVIDVLRATTTIAVLFERGLEQLTVVDDLDAARRLAGETGALLAGEVDGLAPEGFDLGNSPVEAIAADVRGRHAVMFTTNGTTALCAVGDRDAVFAGSLANAPALVEALDRYSSVALLCAGNGRGTRFSLEDFMAAGIIGRLLVDRRRDVESGDAARMAISLAGHWGAAGIRTSRHSDALRSLGLDQDIDFALRLGTATAIPRVVACGEGSATLSR